MSVMTDPPPLCGAAQDIPLLGGVRILFGVRLCRGGLTGGKPHGVRQPVAGFEVVVSRIAEVVHTGKVLHQLADQLGFGHPRRMTEAA